MNFKDKYTDDKNDLTKKQVETDTFLLAEMIELLIKHLSKSK